ncbi:hypothetical protein PoB_001180000 [Plakobranchus ocellatus]|uniref:C-type lectin domain-containing protein n=1 Tax=Plakobranchus ocellatus TaxID=259542 RepID=A0AAV3YQ67_9GAST|nr:hypothetical protein PoB_001180000 [Plakobranchus ocellatus]
MALRTGDTILGECWSLFSLPCPAAASAQVWTRNRVPVPQRRRLFNLSAFDADLLESNLPASLLATFISLNLPFHLSRRSPRIKAASVLSLDLFSLNLPFHISRRSPRIKAASVLSLDPCLPESPFPPFTPIKKINTFLLPHLFSQTTNSYPTEFVQTCGFPNTTSRDRSVVKELRSCVLNLQKELTYLQAQSCCLSLHASLPTINSEADNDILLGRVPVWLNLHKSVWRGKTADSLYTNWANGEPVNSSDYRCVYGSRGNKTWAATSCSLHILAVCLFIPPTPTYPSITLEKDGLKRATDPETKLRCTAVHGRVKWRDTYGGTVTNYEGLKFLDG